MLNSTNAIALLHQAQHLYDSPTSRLSAAASTAWRNGFVSGGKWMALALSELRDVPASTVPANLQALGVIKYGLCCVAALAVMGGALLTGIKPLVLLGVPAFYAVEVQMVFLFPIALDGSPHPFRESRSWTARAGGTLAAMKVVMVLAVVMLFGGFLGQGYIRSWCLGCLAVVIWYEQLRGSVQETTSISGSTKAFRVAK